MKVEVRESACTTHNTGSFFLNTGSFTIGRYKLVAEQTKKEPMKLQRKELNLQHNEEPVPVYQISFPIFPAYAAACDVATSRRTYEAANAICGSNRNCSFKAWLQRPNLHLLDTGNIEPRATWDALNIYCRLVPAKIGSHSKLVTLYIFEGVTCEVCDVIFFQDTLMFLSPYFMAAILRLDKGLLSFARLLFEHWMFELKRNCLFNVFGKSTLAKSKWKFS